MSSRRLEGWDINLWLINAIKGKMIRKWIVLNVFISFIVIIIVGVSIKEYACYQFNLYSPSSGQSEQFRNTIEMYLLYASIVAFVAAVLIHLFFARKILRPLRNLTRNDSTLSGLHTVTSKDEVGKIAKDILHISNQMNELQKQNEQMLTDIAHELRTPLTTLNGYLEGLKDGVFSFDESTTMILKKECERLITLIERINELRDWEQADVFKTDVSMKEMLECVIEEYSSRFQKAGIKLYVHIEHEQLRSNEKAIRVVLRELFNNVLQYHNGKKVLLRSHVEGAYYIISISNKSKPILDEDDNDLFERFYRVEPSRNRDTGGAGLGLAIAKEIVTRLKGEIEYVAKGDMITFRFSIPID